MSRPVAPLGSQKIVKVNTVNGEALLETVDVQAPHTPRYIKRPGIETYQKDAVISPIFGESTISTNGANTTPYDGHNFEELKDPFTYVAEDSRVAAVPGAPPPRKVVRLHGMLSCGFEVQANHRLIVKIEF